MSLILILVVSSVIGFFVSGRLKSRMNYYSQIPNESGLTGAEVARTMLEDYGISGIKIIQGKGALTDHYNPKTRIVALSPDVYHGRSIASTAVAAHESGHVIQHATAYNMLTLRSTLVPLVQFSARMQQFLFMAILLGIATGVMGKWVFWIITVTFGITLLFSLITLPVEFDASRRGLEWIEEKNMLAGQKLNAAKDALKWAAMTYVAKAATALVVFLYFLFSVTNRN